MIIGEKMSNKYYVSDLDKLNEYIFMKHNILPGYQTDNLVEIARNNVGIHAARLQTPFTLLCSRSDNFIPSILIESLANSDELIKLRCMRTTLHIVPTKIAPIFHKATLQLRLAKCRVFFRNKGILESDVEKLKYKILEKIVNRPMDPKEIESSIYSEFDKEVLRFVLKELWELGDICYFNRSDQWGKEERLYCHTSNRYPRLRLNENDELDSQFQLIKLYIERYGPVTLKDIVWWSGLNVSIVKKVLNLLENNITEIFINNYKSIFYMEKNDFEKLLGFKTDCRKWVKLLSYEDSSLKGYFESRSRYIDIENYNYLFNQIGEARASIIVNGKCVGIWEWDKIKNRINWSLFNGISNVDISEIKSVVENYEYRLNNKTQQLLFF